MNLIKRVVGLIYICVTKVSILALCARVRGSKHTKYTCLLCELGDMIITSGVFTWPELIIKPLENCKYKIIGQFSNNPSTLS